MIIEGILLMLLWSVLGVIILNTIYTSVRMYMFKRKLVKGAVVIHHYKKDDFTPVKDVEYTIIDRSKKQIKLMDNDGWVHVKTISFMSPEDYSFPANENAKNPQMLKKVKN